MNKNLKIISIIMVVLISLSLVYFFIVLKDNNLFKNKQIENLQDKKLIIDYNKYTDYIKNNFKDYISKNYSDIKIDFNSFNIESFSWISDDLLIEFVDNEKEFIWLIKFNFENKDNNVEIKSFEIVSSKNINDESEQQFTWENLSWETMMSWETLIFEDRIWTWDMNWTKIIENEKINDNSIDLQTWETQNQFWTWWQEEIEDEEELKRLLYELIES